MSKAEKNQRKLEKAKKIQEQCNLIGYPPPMWIQQLLKKYKKEQGK